jgi:PAS domain S-box-containing protein
LALTAVEREVREDGRARRARVLVVEDDSRMRGILEMLLAKHWDVEVAADGREALDKVRRHVPDLILADLVLPKVDGYELIREVRAHPRTRTVPIVVVSGLADEADRMRALEAGATDFLVKPFSERELFLRVSTQIETALLRDSALRSGADRLRAVLDGALDAVAGVDAEGRVTYWNPRAAATFGWTAEEATGRSFAEIALAPGSRDAVPAAGGRVESEGQRKDGTRFPLELSAVADGTALTVFARDLGGQRAAEEERNRALEESREVARSKDEFLSMLSHELRTPLSAIVGWAHMLRTTELDEATRARAVETIDRNAKVQNQLIEDILDVSRIVAGKFHVDMRSMDLARAVEAAREAVAPSAAAKGVDLQVEIEPGMPPTVGDPDRLQQVAWNLLTNAVRFTPKGGRVRLALARRHDAFEIEVSDTGAGIDPTFLPHVFERFRQGRAPGARRQGGLGLGLSIVRHIVEQHGGSVEARSEGQDKGAAFFVRLPAKDLSEDKVPPLGHERGDEMASAPRLDGLRVLVVDDEPDARDLIAAVLQGRGAAVLVAESSAEALARLRQDRPDVVLSDISMRDEDGYEFIRKVRALPAAEGGRVPAAALTAYGRLEDRMKALGAGFQLHVAKPVDPAELVAVVASLGGRT